MPANTLELEKKTFSGDPINFLRFFPSVGFAAHVILARAGEGFPPRII